MKLAFAAALAACLGLAVTAHPASADPPLGMTKYPGHSMKARSARTLTPINHTCVHRCEVNYQECKNSNGEDCDYFLALCKSEIKDPDSAAYCVDN